MTSLPRLHAVTDDAVVGRADLAERARLLAFPGLALHARAPRAEGGRFTEVARLLGEVCRAQGAAAVVNDRVDIARITGSRGVHLPEHGLPTGVLRALLGTGTWIGRSVHTPDDARREADAGADYVFLGPVWETDSHRGRPALGPRALHGLAPIRVIAIGGVTPGRVATCLDAGAFGVAAIGALWRAPDPAAAASAMLVCLEE